MKHIFTLVFAGLFSTASVFGQCNSTPPPCVDIESAAYDSVIASDTFCCGGTWDNICQNAYNNLSNTCSDSGCTDPLALNYNPLALTDDGTCLYPCDGCGCTDPEALNFDPAALIDDGSCVYDTGDIFVEQSLSAEEMVFNMLMGSGVLVSNVQVTGSPVQMGSFTGGGPWLGMESGLVLSSAHAQNLNMPGFYEDVPYPTGISGDDDLLTVANSVPPLIGQFFNVSSVNDVCALEFDFVPFGDNISFNFLFGSDEYLTWVNTSFNDVFAFFLSGPGIDGPYGNNAVNIATVPGSDPPLPITVSSVNNALNSDLYDHNVPHQGIAINGYTEVFTAHHQGLTPGETYHIRLAIADGTDNILEAVVLLEAGSFTSETEANGSPSDLNGDGWINVNDLLILLGDYGCLAPPACLGDINQDGEVNFEDILEFLAAFG